MKIKNPFHITGYHGPETFCDRDREMRFMMSAIENGRNLNLFNVRRIGKSALINHVLYKLPKSYAKIYIDISQTENQADIVKLLIERITSVLEKLDRNFLRKLASWTSSFGASFSMDPITGSIKIGILPNTKLTEKTLIEAFEFTKKISRKRFVIAIDEFQQIINYPEKNTEALFRLISQEFPEIRFIYSGSSKKLMEKIFANPNAPFYQSTEHISLGYIEEDNYLAFALKYLPNHEESIIHFLKWTRRHTYYTQFALNKLYEISNRTKHQYAIVDVELEILLANKFYYESIRKLVTKDQWNILKGIAANEPIKKPLSGNFSREVNIATSTIKYNLNQLVEKDLVFQEEDGYKIYDVFFGKLLQIKSLDPL